MQRQLKQNILPQAFRLETGACDGIVKKIHASKQISSLITQGFKVRFDRSHKNRSFILLNDLLENLLNLTEAHRA